MSKFLGNTVNHKDGRVQMVCICGFTHPSLRLQMRSVNRRDGIHACCGCCEDRSFKIVEARLVRRDKARCQVYVDNKEGRCKRQCIARIAGIGACYQHLRQSQKIADKMNRKPRVYCYDLKYRTGKIT